MHTDLMIYALAQKLGTPKAMFEYARDNIKYVRDPSLYENARNVLDKPFGDMRSLFC